MDDQNAYVAEEMDVVKALAWDELSAALDENAAGSCSAADVCAIGFEQQERVGKLLQALREV